MLDRIPLPLQLRPKTLAEVVGQNHLVGPGMVFRRMVETQTFQNVLLWGPPGSGKSSIAFALANETASAVQRLDATAATVKDLRAVIGAAITNTNQRTILIVDEVHRWSKPVQEVLLGAIENGSVVFFGLTTESAQFAVTKAIVSRCLILETKPLSNHAVVELLKRIKLFYKNKGTPLTIEREAAEALLLRADGDARKLIMVLETIVNTLKDNYQVTLADINAVLPNRTMFFDSTGSERYNSAHCYQEAIQNSDTNGALYWLGQWLASGEDPAYICRRILVTAAEDCAGNPNAWLAALLALQTTERVGMPECMIAMSLATCEMGQSKRNKSAYYAIKEVMFDIESNNTVQIPPELRAGTSGYKKIITKQYLHGWEKDSISHNETGTPAAEHYRGVMFGIGHCTDKDTYSFGMTHGPTPDINEMLKEFGYEGDVIWRFENGNDTIVYKWDVTIEQWVKV